MFTDNITTVSNVSMACSSLTRLQYAAALRMSQRTSANATWASGELRRRSASLSTALDAHLPSHIWQDVRSACARFNDQDSVRNSASLWDTVNDQIDLLRAGPQQGSAAGGVAEVFRGKEALLDAIQYNVTGIRTLAANSQGRPELEVQRFSLAAAFLSALSDVCALTRDKYGVVPPTVLSGCGVENIDAVGAAAVTEVAAQTPASALHAALPMLGVRAFAEYTCAELLKNAYKATVDRYGAAGVDDAPPVHVRLSRDSRYACISIADSGGGVPSSLARRQRVIKRSCGESDADNGDGGSAYAGAISTFPYFSSTTRAITPPTYTYSRDFGPAYSGKGLGLVRSRLYAQYHGGSLTLLSQPGLGTTALLALERSGSAGSDFVEWPLA